MNLTEFERILTIRRQLVMLPFSQALELIRRENITVSDIFLDSLLDAENPNYIPRRQRRFHTTFIELTYKIDQNNLSSNLTSFNEI